MGVVVNQDGKCFSWKILRSLMDSPIISMSFSNSGEKVISIMLPGCEGRVPPLREYPN